MSSLAPSKRSAIRSFKVMDGVCQPPCTAFMKPASLLVTLKSSAVVCVREKTAVVAKADQLARAGRDIVHLEDRQLHYYKGGYAQ